MQERDERLVLCSTADLIRRTPAPWLVRDIIRQHSMTLLYGAPGAKKSFVALDLAMSLASGVPWQEHEIVTPGLVIYIAAEGGGGVVQRIRAWLEQHPEVDDRKLPLLFLTEPLVIAGMSEDTELLIDRIRAEINWLPAGEVEPGTATIYDHDSADEWPALIVIDTLARCFLGDENQQEDMNAFIQGVDALRIAFNCSVLIIHHSGRDKTRERGSSTLKAACDTQYRLDDEEPEESDSGPAVGTIYLSVEKMKDGRPPAPVAIGFREVPVKRREGDDPNEELTSIVLERPGSDKDRRQQDMLELLSAGPLYHRDWMSQCGLPSKTFNRYVREMRDAGLVERIESGIDQGKYRLASEEE